MIKEDCFDQKVIEQIKRRKIFPRPRILFILKNYGIWLAGFLALVFGSMSSALLIYLIEGDGLALHRRAGASALELFLLSVPFFWLITVGIFVYLAYINLKHTDRGYRYSSWLIGLAVILTSLAAGLVLYNFGFSRTLDNALGRQMPFYEYVANPRIGFWSDLQRGRLSGIIIAQQNDQQIILFDHGQQIWLVDISRIRQPVGLPAIDFQKLINKPIGFWGRKTADKQFEAQGLMPLRGGEGFFNRPDHPLPRPLPPFQP